MFPRSTSIFRCWSPLTCLAPGPRPTGRCSRSTTTASPARWCLQQRPADHRRQYGHAARLPAALGPARPIRVWPMPVRWGGSSATRSPPGSSAARRVSSTAATCSTPPRRPQSAHQEGTCPGLGEEAPSARPRRRGFVLTAVTTTAITSPSRQVVVTGRSARPQDSRLARPRSACMEYLASRKVMTLGIDSPSMGPLPRAGGANPLRRAEVRHDLDRGATGLGQLPATGAFYCCWAPNTPAVSTARAAPSPSSAPLAERLIRSARKKNVVDLSVRAGATDLPVWWPGTAAGRPPSPLYESAFRLRSQPRPCSRDTYPRQPHRHASGYAHLCPAGQGLRQRTYAREVKRLADRV